MTTQLKWNNVQGHYPPGTTPQQLRPLAQLDAAELAQWLRIRLAVSGIEVGDIHLIDCWPGGAFFRLPDESAWRGVSVMNMTPAEFHYLAHECRVDLFNLKNVSDEQEKSI